MVESLNILYIYLSLYHLNGSPGKARTSDPGINSALQLPTVLPGNNILKHSPAMPVQGPDGRP
jgi:hypothetical protein